MENKQVNDKKEQRFNYVCNKKQNNMPIDAEGKFCIGKIQ